MAGARHVETVYVVSARVCRAAGRRNRAGYRAAWCPRDGPHSRLIHVVPDPPHQHPAIPYAWPPPLPHFWISKSGNRHSPGQTSPVNHLPSGASRTSPSAPIATHGVFIIVLNSRIDNRDELKPIFARSPIILCGLGNVFGFQVKTR